MHDENRPVDKPRDHAAWDIASVAQPPNDAPLQAAASGLEPAPPSLRSRSRGSIAPRASGTAAVRAGIVIGSALVVALGAAVVMAASPTTSGSSGPSGQASTAPASSPDAGGSGPPAGAGPRAGKGLFGGLHPFRGLLPFAFGGPSSGAFGPGVANGDRPGGPALSATTVTAVSGDQISLATDDGWTRTITVTANTRVTKGGQPASVSDVKVGDTVRFTEHKNADGTWAITRLAIVLPRAGGTVTAVGSDTITITAKDGTSQTIHTTAQTVYQRGAAAGSRADVRVGSTIAATGERAPDGSITATSVTVIPVRVVGTVTAVGSDTVTIKRPNGTTMTVHLASGTTISVPGVDHATLGNLKPGMILGAEGTQRADGSLDADAIRAGQPGALRDHPGPRPKGAPQASPAPSSATG